MAGKICTGDGDRSGAPPSISESRAFCEGRAAQIAGDLIGTNPYASMGAAMALEDAAWDRGHAAGTAGDPKGCCAE